jgi:hypothetical protein
MAPPRIPFCKCAADGLDQIREDPFRRLPVSLIDGVARFFARRREHDTYWLGTMSRTWLRQLDQQFGRLGAGQEIS